MNEIPYKTVSPGSWFLVDGPTLEGTLSAGNREENTEERQKPKAQIQQDRTKQGASEKFKKCWHHRSPLPSTSLQINIYWMLSSWLRGSRCLLRCCCKLPYGEHVLAEAEKKHKMFLNLHSVGVHSIGVRRGT